MSGLLSGVLPAIYSASNKLQRNVNGLLSDPKNYLAGLLMDANTRAGGLLDATNAATQESSANMAAGRGLFGGPSNNKLAGMLADAYGPGGLTVWHGSPHKFAKFDASKIGTGEGAQAYGHGIYTAESPEVAKSYQSALSADRGFSYGGKSGLTRQEVQELVNAKIGGYLDGVTRPSGVADTVIDDMVLGASRPAGQLPRQYKPDSQRAALYEQLRSEIKHADPGNLYKIDLPDEHIAKMLDWDKPLSQQPEAVQGALSRAGLIDFDKNIGPSAAGEIRDLGWTKNVGSLGGEDLYRRLVERQFMGKKTVDTSARKLSEGEVAAQLRELGIPGIRYLDGGSRGVGAGTSNFVVFPGNEGLLTILERNGIPMR